MRLLLNGTALRITHMGPDFILLDAPADHPPCDAAIFLQVDDTQSQWNVRLPEGISKDSNRVPLALCG